MKERMAIRSQVGPGRSMDGSARDYAYEYKAQSRDGKTSQVSLELINDIRTYELFKTQREKNKI